MSFCPQCQTPIAPQTTTCPRCGLEFGDDSRSTLPTPSPFEQGGTLQEPIPGYEQFPSSIPLAGDSDPAFPATQPPGPPPIPVAGPPQLPDHAGNRGGTIQENAADIQDMIQTRQQSAGGTMQEPSPFAGGSFAPPEQFGPGQGTPPGSGSAAPPAGGKPSRRTSGSTGNTDGSDSAIPYRPVNRPPTLLLCALDDGSRDDGEWFRVRKSNFVIGRGEGDIIIGHDNGISGKHLEVTLRVEEGRYRFYLKDLGSRNGTFVRVSRALIRNRQEVLLGAKRYYFVAGGNATDPSSAVGTAQWTGPESSDLGALMPSVVEMTPRGDGERYSLQNTDTLVGSDANRCGIVLPSDPFISAVHARIFKDQKKRWVVENQNSLNGVWMRIDEMPLDTGGEFQIGEQRFLVRIP